MCQCQSGIFSVAKSKNSLNCCKVHDSTVRKFTLECPEMSGETGMSSAVNGRKRQTVQTARRLAECSRKWRLRQETSDDRLLADGTAGYLQLQRERRPQTATTLRVDTGTN